VLHNRLLIGESNRGYAPYINISSSRYPLSTHTAHTISFTHGDVFISVRSSKVAGIPRPPTSGAFSPPSLNQKPNKIL